MTRPQRQTGSPNHPVFSGFVDRCFNGMPDALPIDAAGTNGAEQHFTHRNWLAGHIVEIVNSAEYRAKALELLLLAGRTCDDAIRNELLNLAVSYVRLADHVERAASRSEQTGTAATPLG